MAEPSSSTAGGFALAKIVGGLLGISVVASGLGFLVLLPKTPREAAVRIAATLAGSTFIGPFLCIILYWKYPGIFDAGRSIALMMGAKEEAPLIGILMISAPLLAMSGLPFWWILGAVVRWFDSRKDKDIVQMLEDGKESLKGVVP